MDFLSLPVLLALFSGICWLTVYVEAIRVSLRDRSCAIPFWALSLNLAWETLHSYFGFRLEGASLQAVINLLWAVFDLAVLATWFRFGRKDVTEMLAKRLFIPGSLLAITVSFILQHAFVIEFGVYQGRAYAAFLQNLLMSVLFIDMLGRRKSTEGQSLTIASGKWLGTLAPTILFGIVGTREFNGPNRLLLVIGLLCSLFDLIYIVLLAKTKIPEKEMGGGRLLL